MQVQCNKNILKIGNEGNFLIRFLNLNINKYMILYFFLFLDVQFKLLLYYFYYKLVKVFLYFDYFYNLIWKCIECIEWMEKSEG